MGSRPASRLKLKQETTRYYPITSVINWLFHSSKGNRLQAALNLLTGIAMVFLDFIFVWTTKKTIDIATQTNQSYAIIEAALYLTAIITLRIILSICNKWIKALFGVKAQNQMQNKLLTNILESDRKSIQKYHSGDLLNRLEKDVSNIVLFITENVPNLITVLFRLVGAFFLIYYFNMQLACILLATIPLLFFPGKFYFRRMRRITHSIRQSESRIQSLLQESIQQGLILKVMDSDQQITHKLSEIQSRLQTETCTRTRYSSYSSLIINITFSGGYLITFLWSATQLQAGIITYGMMIAFIQLIGQIQSPIRSLTQLTPYFINCKTSAERLMELEKEIIKEDNRKKRLSHPLGIQCKNITFSYSDTQKKILHQFSHDFTPGSRTAIIGETGIGKTTLTQLILALQKAEKGEIWLYNKTVKVHIDNSTRCNFAYMPQGNTLFSGTIRSNLLIGNPKATEQEMKNVLRLVCADFVFSHPKGLDRECGEQGQELSQGQAQRICIARTLLHKAAIYIFDEATSSLDSATENKILQNISKAKDEKTYLFITHRENVLKYCTECIHFS